MSGKNRCRSVRKLLHTMPKGGCEETLRRVSKHLSECDACRGVHAEVQTMDKVLIPSKLRFDEAARRGAAGKSRILTEIAKPPQMKGSRRLHLAWAGAGAAILAITGAAAIYLFRGGNGQPPGRPLFSAPRVTRATAATARSEALRDLVEPACRHRASSFELPYTPQASASESLFPRLRMESTLQSEEMISMIVEPKTILMRRDEG